MKKYQNVRGNSNVNSYEVGQHSIVVSFKSGRLRNYQYTYQTTGASHVEKMKELAEQGYGLNSYISTVVRKRYETKW